MSDFALYILDHFSCFLCVCVMHEACRHCCAVESSHIDSSYLEALVYHSNANSSISNVLRWIEEQADSGVFCFPGIVMWCADCRNHSVISYQHYVSMCRGDLIAESAILSESVYYTRMCMGADYLWDMQSEGIMMATAI